MTRICNAKGFLMDEEGWSWGVGLVAASTYNDLVWVIE